MEIDGTADDFNHNIAIPGPTGCDALPEGTVVLTGEGFAELPGKELYSTEPPEFRPVTYRAIPYALWQNRGNAEMEIFFTLK